MLEAGKTYVLTGVVLPERALVSVDPEKPINIYCQSEEFEANISISIILNKISLVVKIINANCNIFTFRNAIRESVESIVDTVGFYHNYSFTVEITSLVKTETGETYVFGIFEPIFGNKNPFLQNASDYIGLSIHETAQLAIENNFLNLALKNFREALRIPEDTSFFCYRAIESIRHSYKGSELNQWKEMEKAIQTTEDEVRDLKRRAGSLRHGEQIPQPWEDRQADLSLTWKIIRKFILSLKNEPLDRLFGPSD